MDRKEIEEIVQQDLETRVREGIKALFEQIQKEMTQHLGAPRYQYQRSPTRRGRRNGEYERDLVTGVGTIHQLRVPRDREGTFQTELFERYRRLTGSVEEAILEMYLQGVSTRKVAAVTEALSGKRVGRDAVSRITARLEEQVQAWRERELEEGRVPLSLPGCHLPQGQLGREGGQRSPVGGGRSQLRRLPGVVGRGSRSRGAGGRLAEPAAWSSRSRPQGGTAGDQRRSRGDQGGGGSAQELPGVAWQRCVVHFERSVLAHIPDQAKEEVASDLKAVFAVRREETAEALAQEFIERWGKAFPKAVEVFERGIEEALVYLYLDFPSAHHRRIRTTNGLERLFQEIKRRTRVIGAFPNERSLVVLTTTVGIRVTEEWALRRYLDMRVLEAQRQIQSGDPQFTQLSRR